MPLGVLGLCGGVVPFFRIFTDLSTSLQKGSRRPSGGGHGHGGVKYSWQRPGGVRASSSRPKLNLRERGRESISGGRTSSGSIAKELLYLSN